MPATLTRVTQPAGGWTFYGQAQGGPTHALQASMDEGGNLWVAGGEEGLFLLRSGGSAFERFTLTDGLRPYGYMPDGSAPSGGAPTLNVIAVEGGPGGTVYVGYQGQSDCESNFYSSSATPSDYKSGDADKVTLNPGGGISVVHYDIFTGPGTRGEVIGREKICSVYRIVYDGSHLWFGGNHAFAMGFPDFGGNPTCNGQENCAGDWEHVHPVISIWRSEDHSGGQIAYTGKYRGVSVDPVTHDIWFGGDTRSTKFKFATAGGYLQAEPLTEGDNSNKLDIWPDHATAEQIPTRSQLVEDLTDATAGMADGTVWMGSSQRGLAHLDAQGRVLIRVSSQLLSPVILGLAADPKDQSLWIGGGGGAVQRMKEGQLWIYDSTALGSYAASRVNDIQVQASGGSRVIIVSFDSGVGLYRGD